jgi:hypothetical protein
MTPELATQHANAIKKMVIGAIVSEYGALEIKGNAKQDLKQRVNMLANQAKSIQRYFLTHPQCTEETRRIFKEEFHRDELYLLSEIVMLLWGVKFEDLENIFNTLREHIND